MAAALPPPGGNAARRHALVAAALAMPERRFAVIDGAHFDNLQRELIVAGLDFRPLYLDEKDAPALASGPHLVPLRNRHQVEQAAEIAGDKPAIVFWSWPEAGDKTVDQMHRHLRSINLVEIPRGADDPDAGAKADAHDHDGHEHPLSEWETVLLRHADPNVLAALLPLLRPEQVSRFLGRSLALVFDAPDYAFATPGGQSLRAAPRPADLPGAPKGWLRIEDEQYEGLTNARVQLASRRVFDYLRKVAPQQTAKMDDRALADHVARSMQESVGFGVTSEASHCRWAYLQLLSGGKLMHHDPVREMIYHPERNHSPDQRIEILMNGIIGSLRSAV